jgi:RNA-directed DNA polymerase
MSQLNLFNFEQGLFERVCSIEELQAAYKTVRSNHGAPGVDGVTVEEFGERLNRELPKLKFELENWKYKPQPAKRVEIPKPGGVRFLGIPTVRDRVVQTAMKNALEEIFEPKFSANSYGFRPGRNQKQAVTAAQKIVESGKPYVIDIDLSRFFDRIQHDRLVYRLGLEVKDKRILRLVGITLRSGIMQDGLVSASTEGSVQGSPLSPLLSNVVLDELDKELESRGLSFCRWADDCNIFVKSQKAASRVMSTVSRFIEEQLKLVVNREKSKVALSEKVKFLGMTIIAGTIAISAVSLHKAMEKVKELTPRGTSQSIETSVERINRWYGGWANYFKMTQYPAQLAKIEAHIRRRLRARIVSQQKRKRHLFEKLVQRGVKRTTAAKVFGSHRKWALSHMAGIDYAYSKSYFIKTLGQTVVSDNRLPHWFKREVWIKLT